MKQSIWSQKYNVNTFLVNPQKRLGLFGLLNLIQDTAWIHATHLGHGYDQMMKEKTAWVLTRQVLQMDEWPLWGDDVELVTWVRPLTGIVAVRDFEIRKEERVIGRCSTQWLILNLETRKAADKTLSMNPEDFRQDAPDFLNAGKILLPGNLAPVAEFNVRNSDLDLNAHVNNTRYAQWVLDSTSQEKLTTLKLTEYEVNFLNETFLNDCVTIQKSPRENESSYFSGVRKSDGKTVFTARVKVSA